MDDCEECKRLRELCDNATTIEEAEEANYQYTLHIYEVHGEPGI